MSQEVLNSHQSRITCLPNPGDYRLLNFIGKKELLQNVINNNCNNNNHNHNCNKILKSNLLSPALISALRGQFNRTVRISCMLLNCFFFTAGKKNFGISCV